MTNPVIPVPIDDHDEDLAVIQKPFKIQVADRISHLPPYLFARINQLRDQKRRAGADVIDMAMGNPSDPPSEMVIEKLCEAARDLRITVTHRQLESKIFAGKLPVATLRNGGTTRPGE